MPPVNRQDLRNTLLANISATRERITAACRRAGRDPASVRLVAVTKSVPVAVVAAALEAGLTSLAENRVQQLISRAAEIDRLVAGPSSEGAAAVHPTRPIWHFIGHLQRNKVRALLAWSRVIHSVDSPRLAETISAEAARLDCMVNVFLQVNIAGEDHKFGETPGAAAALAEKLQALPHLRLVGLMTMAPWFDDPQRARPVFAELRRIRGELVSRGVVGPNCQDLSMGMSHDFEIAVEEGATVVRIGTALFEGTANGS